MSRRSQEVELGIGICVVVDVDGMVTGVKWAWQCKRLSLIESTVGSPTLPRG